VFASSSDILFDSHLDRLQAEIPLSRLCKFAEPSLPPACDFKRYKDHNRVERMFGYLKHQRRIAARYHKTALSFANFFNIAAARLQLEYFYLKKLSL
jgi:transposase